MLPDRSEGMFSIKSLSLIPAFQFIANQVHQVWGQISFISLSHTFPKLLKSRLLLWQATIDISQL